MHESSKNIFDSHDFDHMFMSQYSPENDKMSYSRNDKPHVTKDLR